MPDARPVQPPVVHDTAPVVGRRILCTHCNQPTVVYEIPHPYVDPATYTCSTCIDQYRAEAAVQAEAEDRRGSFFQVPSAPVPYNEFPPGYGG